MAKPCLSVIISTYNQPRWLVHCLTGFVHQRLRDVELIIADDGSGPETAAAIASFRLPKGMSLVHLWQEDQGFRKCTILNKAIVAASSDYLVFTDGDCIPRSDFLSTHLTQRLPSRFLSGGYVKLPRDVSNVICGVDIERGRHADPGWLSAKGFVGGRQRLKLIPPGLMASALDRFSPARASWNGHNASGWKRDLLAVNGFDERMQYGGEDRELGERLVNAGVLGKRIRFRTTVIHLDHDRPYVDQTSLSVNRDIRRETREKGQIWTVHGIEKGDGGANGKLHNDTQA